MVWGAICPLLQLRCGDTAFPLRGGSSYHDIDMQAEPGRDPLFEQPAVAPANRRRERPALYSIGLKSRNRLSAAQTWSIKEIAVAGAVDRSRRDDGPKRRQTDHQDTAGDRE
jgi:hypothetical protein